MMVVPAHESAPAAMAAEPGTPGVERVEGSTARAGTPPTREHAVYETFEQARHLQADWDGLAERCGDVLASFEWCEAWWRHFGAGRRLEIHVLRADGRLVGVLPLFRERLRACGMGLRVVRLVGCDYAIDAAGLAIEPAHAAALLDRVLEALDRRGGWDIVQLGPLHNYASVTETLAQAAAGHTQVQTALLGRCDAWETQADLPATYEDYLASLAGSERRDTLRRERKLREGRHVEIEEVTQPEEVEAALDALVRMHQALWTERGKLGHFGEFPAVPRFHREMAQRTVRGGRLSLITLKVDGEIVGVTYGYHFGPRTHSIFRGYRNDEPWRSYALGRLLHCHTVRLAIARGSKMIENGLGVSEYKLRLGDKMHGQRSLVLLRRGWTSRLRFWLGLRAAYLFHGLYGRVWLDIVAPRMGLHVRPRHCYVHSSFLAKMYRRTTCRLFGGPALQELAEAARPAIAAASSAAGR